MTNYEKYQDKIIEMLFDNGACSELKKIILNNIDVDCLAGISANFCIACSQSIKDWLKEDADRIDPCVFKAGDKIYANKKDGERNIYEIVCNSFPILWLRRRLYGQCKDENFLISYDDLMDNYKNIEVIK